ncbi:MAG: hypothetical protein ACRDHE_02050 [Ktedonobacterales bacterium]
MLTDHPRKVRDQLAEQPADVREKYASEIEIDLREQQRIAAQLANPKETDLDYLLVEADREVAAGQVFDLDELLKPQWSLA